MEEKDIHKNTPIRIKLDFIEESRGDVKSYVTKLDGEVIEGTASYDKEEALKKFEEIIKESNLKGGYKIAQINTTPRE